MKLVTNSYWLVYCIEIAIWLILWHDTCFCILLPPTHSSSSPHRLPTLKLSYLMLIFCWAHNSLHLILYLNQPLIKGQKAQQSSQHHSHQQQSARGDNFNYQNRGDNYSNYGNSQQRGSGNYHQQRQQQQFTVSEHCCNLHNLSGYSVSAVYRLDLIWIYQSIGHIFSVILLGHHKSWEPNLTFLNGTVSFLTISRTRVANFTAS